MEQGKPFSASESPLVDFDGVCQRVRAAIDITRVHAVSLHDEKGDVLCLTESSMGPDEHNAVREAFDAFSIANGRPIVAYDLGDSRSAVLFRAVNVRRALVGAIMVVMDTKGIQRDDQGLARLMTPKLQHVLSAFAGMRTTAATTAPAPTVAQAKPSAPTAAGRRSTGMAPAVELTLADSMRIPKPALPPATRAAPSGPVAQRRQVSTVTPDIDRLHAAMRRSPIALHVQRLVPLTKGSQLRRYEVLLRSKSDDAPNAAPQAMLKAAVENGLGSMIDRRVLTQLIAWLVHHPQVWRTQAVLFSVNLTSTALRDEHFIKFVGLCLAKSSLPKSMIGFEIDVPTAVNLGDRVAEVAAALHRLGCPLVLDDFGLRTECFDLLRLPAVRYVKLASEITAKMRSDKLSQAAITAVVQMARVLGMYTVAKRTETAAEHEWLTALGVDFVQSNALSPAVTIDSLLKAPKPKS
jgi:EAL domain-containing protein (putative c-di-GMP-specific phosphodiesterase class I)